MHREFNTSTSFWFLDLIYLKQTIKMLFFFIENYLDLSVFKLVLSTGVSERVADIKTRAHAMRCLTTFCESVGPGFIFERVSTAVCIMFYKRHLVSLTV